MKRKKIEYQSNTRKVEVNMNSHLMPEKQDFSYVIDDFPFPIAFNYSKMLNEKDWEKKTRDAVWTFEFSLRTVVLCLLSQYLLRDLYELNDDQFNQTLLSNFSKPMSLGSWKELFFNLLLVYQGHPERLFFSELDNLYWDRTKIPSRQKSWIRPIFERLTKTRNDLSHETNSSTNWQFLCEETLDLLHTVLSFFSFLKNYKLVCAKGYSEKGLSCDLYSGCETASTDMPGIKPYLCEEGRFYFVNEVNEVLALHPLLIFWETSVDSSLPPVSDAGLFDAFQKNRLDYLMTILGKKISIRDKELLEEFTDIVFGRVEEIIKEKKNAKRLSWDQLKVMTLNITKRRISSNLKKYNSSVYLQRQNTYSAFEEFIRSDSKCFVLTGKSGVGKSNFLLSLLDTFAINNPNTCFLIYNGAKIPTSIPVSEVVEKDFQNHLQSQSESGWQDFSNPFYQIGRIKDISNCKVIICIDAINENQDAKQLLRNIDYMVESSLYPWLKVVITARTEAWRIIHRGVQLAESFYYREKDEDRIGVEMQSFSVELSPFTHEELEDAFEKYKHEYRIKSEYKQLPFLVRSAIRDPLVLRLVAETYQGKEIPHYIDVDDLYRKYIDHLISTGRLDPEDFLFLETELLPLMVNESNFSNKITYQQVMKAKTSTGNNLSDYILNNSKVGEKQINQSFINLTDTEILLRSGGEQFFDISFKYERFYDYFIGNKLVELFNSSNPILINKYDDLFLRLTKSPFLWGPVKKLIIEQVRLENYDLIAQLTFLTNQANQKVISEALIDYAQRGEKEKNDIELLLNKILQQTKPMDKPHISPVQNNCKAAKTIVVEVAKLLHYHEILVDTAIDNDPIIRFLTVEGISKMWECDVNNGKLALEGLMKKMVKHILIVPLFDKAAVETFLGTVIAIFTRNYKNPRLISPLSEIVRNVINHILPINLESWTGSFVGKAIFPFFLNIALGIIERATNERPQDIPANLQEIGVFFDRPNSEKVLMNDLLPLFYKESGPIKDHINTLKKITKVNDGDMNWVIVHLLARRGLDEPIEVGQIISELFEIQVNPTRPSYHASFLMGSLCFIISNLDPNSENCRTLMLLFDRLLKKYMEKTNNRVYYERMYIATHLHIYVGINYLLYRQFDIKFVEASLKEAVNNKDWELLKGYIFGLGNLGTQYPYPALSCLSLLFNEKQKEVVNSVADALARIRSVFPEEELDFLSTNEMCQELKDQLTMITVDGTVGDMLRVSVTNFLLDATTSNTLRDSMVLLLGQMPHMKNYKEWFNVLTAYIINLSYQGPVFKVKMFPVYIGHKTIDNPYT